VLETGGEWTYEYEVSCLSIRPVSDLYQTLTCVGLAQAARMARDPTLVKSKVDPFSRRPTQLSNYWSTKAEAADAAPTEETPAEEAPILEGRHTRTACPPSPTSSHLQISRFLVPFLCDGVSTNTSFECALFASSTDVSLNACVYGGAC